MAEIALVLDANVCSDMLGQAELLAKGLNDSSDLKARIVVWGPVDRGCAVVRRFGDLRTGGQETHRGTSVFHLAAARGLAALDVLNVTRSEALAGCDLLHCFSLSLIDVLLSVAGSKQRPGWCLSLSCWPGRQLIRKLSGQRARLPRRIICFADALQEALLKGGVSAQRCSVISPEPPIQQKTGGRLAARKQLNVPEDMELLLADSEISCSSNQRQLSWAAAIIGQFRPRLRVLMGGSNGQLARVRAFDDSLNPPSLGIYPGEQFEPEVLYAASDIVVLPATGAISPLPLLRAGRCGLPVVASDSPAFRQYLRHEVNGLLFSPNRHTPGDRSRQRIRPLASAIVRLLEDRGLARRLGEQLGQDIEQSFSPGRALPAHLELYRQILG